MKQIEEGTTTVPCEDVCISSVEKTEEKIENVSDSNVQSDVTITPVINGNSIKNEPEVKNKNVEERKFALRPRKSEPNEESTKKKRSLHKKAEENVLPNEPPVLICANENNGKEESNESMLPPELPVEEELPVVVKVEEPGVGIKTEPKTVEEIVPVKINENSESSTSDHSNNSKKRKKRRRKREKWVIKKRKNDKNKIKGEESDLGTSTIDSENSRNTSPSLSEISNGKKRKNSESSDNSNKKSREFVVPSPSLADINVKAAIPESTATSVEVRFF